MKNFVLHASAVVLSASTAIAGSMAEPIIEPTPVGAAPVSNWAGAYVGANLTWGQADLDSKGPLRDLFVANGFDKTVSELDGFGGGIRAGYDWQINEVVLGVGGDYNIGKIEGDEQSAAFAVFAGGPIDVEFSNVATVFSRIGYDAGAWLPYALVGYTWADGKVNTTGFSESFDMEGATFGLGVERRLSEHWTAYGEWAYTDFGTVLSSAPVAGFEASMNQIKLGANYQF